MVVLSQNGILGTAANVIVTTYAVKIKDKLTVRCHNHLCTWYQVVLFHSTNFLISLDGPFKSAPKVLLKF